MISSQLTPSFKFTLNIKIDHTGYNIILSNLIIQTAILHIYSQFVQSFCIIFLHFFVN